VPPGGLFLTAGADVQHDRIELDVWAWGRGLESCLIEHVVLDGETSRPEVWDRLTALLDRTWPHARGAQMRLARLAVDSGDGRSTAAVYGWVRKAGAGQALAVKGIHGFDRTTPVDGPTAVDVNEAGRRLRRGAAVWKVSVAVFKSETYRFLRLDRPTDEEIAAGGRFPAGYMHLPLGTTAEWIKQLTAEQLVTTRDQRGVTRLEWRQLRERNEALDCRVYARAAARIAGADRWTEAKWRDLESQVAASKADDELADHAPAVSEGSIAGMVRRAPLRRGRRVFRSSYLS
jgi:phage terminase large subunit GpA-like protein